MTRRYALSLQWLAALLLAACASDGGVTGTGISSIVAGHVMLADGSSAAGVEVSVGDVHASVDEAGNFDVTGEFSGPTELRFSRPGQPNEVGALQLEIPAGSTTVLEGVTVDFRSPEHRVTLTVARHGSVVGRIQTVSCISNTGVAIELENRSFFSFLLSDDVVIRDQAGALLDCADLERGDRIDATGVQLSDGTSIAFSIDLTERPAEPLDEFSVEFGGSVNNVDCDERRLRTIVLTDADPFFTSVRVRQDTEFFCVDGDGPRPCACTDIEPLDIVQLQGIVSVTEPGAVIARSIYVFPGPAIVDAEVVIRKVRCNARRLDTEAFFATTSQAVIARFDLETDFQCEGVVCECRDLNVDDVVRLVGIPSIANGRVFVDAFIIERDRR